jgi:hypothetical protein
MYYLGKHSYLPAILTESLFGALELAHCHGLGISKKFDFAAV